MMVFLSVAQELGLFSKVFRQNKIVQCSVKEYGKLLIYLLHLKILFSLSLSNISKYFPQIGLVFKSFQEKYNLFSKIIHVFPYLLHPQTLVKEPNKMIQYLVTSYIQFIHL